MFDIQGKSMSLFDPASKKSFQSPPEQSALQQISQQQPFNLGISSSKSNNNTLNNTIGMNMPSQQQYSNQTMNPLSFTQQEQQLQLILQQQQQQQQQILQSQLLAGNSGRSTSNNNGTPNGHSINGVQFGKYASPHHLKQNHKQTLKQQQMQYQLQQLKQLQQQQQQQQNAEMGYQQTSQNSNLAAVIQQLNNQLKNQTNYETSYSTQELNLNSNLYNTANNSYVTNRNAQQTLTSPLPPHNDKLLQMSPFTQLLQSQQAQLAIMFPHCNPQSSAFQQSLQPSINNVTSSNNNNNNNMFPATQSSYSSQNININMNINMNLQLTSLAPTLGSLNSSSVNQMQQYSYNPSALASHQQQQYSSNPLAPSLIQTDQQQKYATIISSAVNPNNPYQQDRSRTHKGSKLPKIRKDILEFQLQQQQQLQTPSQLFLQQQQLYQVAAQPLQLQQSENLLFRGSSRDKPTVRAGSSSLQRKSLVSGNNQQNKENSHLNKMPKTQLDLTTGTSATSSATEIGLNLGKEGQQSQQSAVISPKQPVIVEDEEKVKCSRYFRYHIAQLLHVLGKKEQYFTNLAAKKTIKTFALINQSIGSKHLAHLSKGTLGIISKVKKLVATKGKYKYRERFNFMNSAQLKSVNYDVKKRLNQLQEKKVLSSMKSKDEYNESSEEDETPVKAKSQNNGVQQTDLVKWKKFNRLEQKTKVFIIKGGYHDLRRALVDRGWVENTDYSSPCFDLKWTCKVQNIDYENLSEFQVVNHFENNQVFTSKYGISRNLRTLIHSDSTDVYSYFPRCFDLADLQEFEDFIENFKITKAESLLHKFEEILSKENVQIDDKLEVKILVCNEIVARKNIDFYEQVDFIFNQDLVPCVSPEEWEVVSRDDWTMEHKKLTQMIERLYLHPCLNLRKQVNSISNKSTASENRRQSLQLKTSQHDKKKIKHMHSQPIQEEEQSCHTLKDEVADDQESNGNQNFNDEESFPDESTKRQQQQRGEQTQISQKQIKRQRNLLELCQDTLKKSAQKDPQHHLNGKRNIWIVKPNFLSRGRGIKCFNNLDKIMDYVVGKETQFVVQKYIENPLLINNKKFDMRQWAIVQDFCPPRIWFYDECYLRLCSVDHNIDDLNNRFVHLTNNVVQKANKEGYQDKDELMMKQDQFAAYLQEVEGRDVFYNEIQPKLKQMVIQSLRCCADQVGARKNSMEFVGYDFMIDSNYQPWLIEINSSPSMEYSTSITKDLVKRVLTDTVKVVVDYSQAKKGTKKSIDTGGFKLIYKGDKQPKQLNKPIPAKK